jgi:NAD(P)-dependent dehydrogenase (short-subunit alcohol dehydrogenase family)
MGLLDGKVAVITGAGSGMAKASVGVFVREGAQVIAADFSGAEEETAALYGDEVVAVHCDVTKEAEVEAAVATAVSTFGGLDAMLNVAGIADGCMVSDITDDMYDRIVDVDLRGVIYGMKHAIRTMTTQGTANGSIVNWSSVGGLNGSAGTAIYSAAKAGVLAATRSAAVECGPAGIRVNAICPGFILTEIMGAMGADIPGIAEKAALNRVGQSSEVAEVGAFLASDRASFITGAVIPVDGGWSARLA